MLVCNASVQKERTKLFLDEMNAPAAAATLFSLLSKTTNHTIPSSHFPKFAKFRPFFSRIACSRNAQPQELNLSVLRFTLGIPGLDESYLPRYIGYTFGALLLLNHFLGSDSSAITSAQLRTEVLGFSLAGFSVIVPFLGKFLKGATPTDSKSIQEGTEQIFIMSKHIADTLKDDLAWGTYALLRNTNSISVLISVKDAICVRGYWNLPEDLSKENVPDWFGKQIENIGFSQVESSLYFRQTTDLKSDLMGMLPEGVCSLVVQPILHDPEPSSDRKAKSVGFVLLASSIEYACSDKDKAWIAAVAKKFRG